MTCPSCGGPVREGLVNGLPGRVCLQCGADAPAQDGAVAVPVTRRKDLRMKAPREPLVPEVAVERAAIELLRLKGYEVLKLSRQRSLARIRCRNERCRHIGLAIATCQMCGTKQTVMPLGGDGSDEGKGDIMVWKDSLPNGGWVLLEAKHGGKPWRYTNAQQERLHKEGKTAIVTSAVQALEEVSNA